MSKTTNNEILGGDDRLKKSDDAGRANRESSDDERSDHDGLVVKKSERRMSFRDEWTQDALPTPPAVPGYHLCWLSTTNSYDPIHKRMRMGYEPVKAEEVPGFEIFKMKSGEFTGFVACNEMLLFKIKSELYQEIMTYFHHEKPLEEEEMLKQNTALRDSQAAPVATSAEEDGFKSIGKPRHAPVFS